MADPASEAGADEGEITLESAADEEIPAETPEQALALNADGLRYWLREVTKDNLRLEKEIQLSKAARLAAAEMCRRGTPYVDTSAQQASTPTTTSRVPRKRAKKRKVIAVVPVSPPRNPSLGEETAREPEAPVPDGRTTSVQLTEPPMDNNLASNGPATSSDQGIPGLTPGGLMPPQPPRQPAPRGDTGQSTEPRSAAGQSDSYYAPPHQAEHFAPRGHFQRPYAPHEQFQGLSGYHMPYRPQQHPRGLYSGPPARNY